LFVGSSAGSNGMNKAPSFAVRMKPVAFNIKPKKGPVSTSTKQLTKDAPDDRATVVSKVSVEEDDPQSNSVVTSLTLAYGSDDDFE